MSTLKVKGKFLYRYIVNTLKEERNFVEVVFSLLFSELHSGSGVQ